MSWNENPPMKQKSQQANLFFKLKGGESAKIVIRGDPYTFYSVFEHGKSLVVKKDDPGARFRFRVNIIVKEPSGYVIKIFEGGARLFYSLKDIKQDYDLNNTVIKLSRTGDDKDTVWTVMPLPGGIDEKTQNAISGLKLNELENKKKKPESDDLNAFLDAPVPDWDNKEELPF